VHPAAHLPAAQLVASPLSASAYIGGGLLVLFLVLFAETGLLVGFFLPGDTLLLLAGDYTNSGKAHHLAFGSAVIVGIAGALIGAQTGFLIGRQAGPRLFESAGRRERLARAHTLLDRLGEGRSVVAARFIPLVRTFINPAVGATGMSARSFTLWNVVGGVIWVPVVLLLGRAVGSKFPLDKIVVVVVIVSLVAAAVAAIRERRRTTSS